MRFRIRNSNTMFGSGVGEKYTIDIKSPVSAHIDRWIFVTTVTKEEAIEWQKEFIKDDKLLGEYTL
jgi:hypothetical protein